MSATEMLDPELIGAAVAVLAVLGGGIWKATTFVIERRDRAKDAARDQAAERSRADHLLSTAYHDAYRWAVVWPQGQSLGPPPEPAAGIIRERGSVAAVQALNALEALYAQPDRQQNTDEWHQQYEDQKKALAEATKTARQPARGPVREAG